MPVKQRGKLAKSVGFEFFGSASVLTSSACSQVHQSDPKEWHSASGIPGCIGARGQAERGPAVVDMSFDDTDQDEEVSMAGNRFAALSDHNSDRSVVGVRDIRRRDGWCWSHNRMVLNARAITSGMPTLTASPERQMLKWGMWSNPAEEIPVVIEPRIPAVGGAFASLDVVNISEVFDRSPKLMQTVLQ